MNHTLILSLSILFVNISADYEWAIIGAGPAGITTIGVLLDSGVPANKIAWIDPEFKVGRLPNYNHVPANNPTSKFIYFMQNCETFKKCKSEEISQLFEMDPTEHHELKVITKPLQCITNQIRNKVSSFETHMHYLFFERDEWNILTNNDLTIKAKNVVLATGSKPKSLDLHKPGSQIPLDVALNRHQLKQAVTTEDTVAVIGSAHSAVLILKFLCDLNVKKIYNFYNKNLIIETPTGQQIDPTLDLFGIAAKWVKEVLCVNPPSNLERLRSIPNNLDRILPNCTKTIYAVGYKPNPLPEIKETANYSYDKNGKIGQRLFGIGIAFPQVVENEAGNLEPQVGLKAFLDYAQKAVSIWMNQEKIHRLRQKQAKLIEALSEVVQIELL